MELLKTQLVAELSALLHPTPLGPVVRRGAFPPQPPWGYEKYQGFVASRA